MQVQASRGIGVFTGNFVHLPLWQKLAPLALIFFCATFNHTLLVNMKVGRLSLFTPLRIQSHCAEHVCVPGESDRCKPVATGAHHCC